MGIRPGWYILAYHNISWREGPCVRSLGGTLPPDIFVGHVRAAASRGELVSVSEGARRLEEGAVGRPLFSFWFDDGLTGVKRYAKPVLDDHGVTAAVSVCSRLARRSELFWRFQLSWLDSVDALSLLRSRLRSHGLMEGEGVKHFTLDHFSPVFLDYIDELWRRFTTPQQREDAAEMFLEARDIAELFDSGWTIANHTAGHYPVSQEHSLPRLCGEFEECQQWIRDSCGTDSGYWVVPFDWNSSDKAVEAADRCRGDRYLVFMGNRGNFPGPRADRRLLFRLGPEGSAADLLRLLRQS